MDSERYDIIENGGGDEYIFFSEGPRGRIRKGVRFQPFPQMGKNVCNLAFGDIDEHTGKLNDLTVSNNGDLDKILRAVAEAAVRFIESRPGVILLVQGSSLSRTRLYQMKISKFLEAIRLQFEVYGFHGQKFMPFTRGVNYRSFLILKK